jgi:hypothetical protein
MSSVVRTGARDELRVAGADTGGMVMGPVAVDAPVSGGKLALGELGTVPGIVMDVAAVRGALAGLPARKKERTGCASWCPSHQER